MAGETRHDDDSRNSGLGRFRVPFPLDFIVGVFALPALFLAAGVSIPAGWVRKHRVRQQERLFTARMRSAARLLSWDEAKSQAAANGTWIADFLSPKGPYRLWWSPDDLPSRSPHPCCFDRIPWAAEDSEFFRWCHDRYTDPEMGTALLVESADVPPAEIERVLAERMTCHRFVSIGPADYQA